jgi:nitrate reductase NapE component
MTSNEGKGRPTPKRKDVESKRKISSLAPIVGKEQKRASKALARESRVAQRAAYLRGDEAALPARDRGPARRYVRNYVDARRSIGEYFLPIIFIVLVLTLFPIAAVQVGAVALMYAVLVTAVIDGIFLSRKIRKAVESKFPGTSTKGLGMYAWLRSTQMRRLRAPHPQVKVGESIN